MFVRVSFQASTLLKLKIHLYNFRQILGNPISVCDFRGHII